MDDWISGALENSGAVVTANRRLARHLKLEFGLQQQRAGRKAWASPAIDAWQDWLQKTCGNTSGQETLPTRINAHQSQWLWEKCWRQEFGEQSLNIVNLVRLSREAWQRLADWQLSITDITRAAQNDNQRMFAAVAGRYRGMLNRDNLIDDAGMANLLLTLIDDKRIDLASRYTFAGFDRKRPIAATLQKAMLLAGASIQHAPQAAFENRPTLQIFENSSAELRAAGIWARTVVDARPGARVAIIAHGLETDGDGITRRVREGVTPGWQHGYPSLFDAVNVSYGRRLSDYPAVAIALTLLRWLVSDLSSRDISLLLRSPLLGGTEVSARSRLELSLRQMPDRGWTPSMVTSEFRGREEDPHASDWLTRLAEFSKRRRELPKSASPAEWAIFLFDTLKGFGWPGDASLASDEFQLINRWRELLNEFARLALVSPSMTPQIALTRLDLMAGETVFQPESRAALVQLMGPLEASGAEFDAVWITGLSSANWPPSGSPSVLVSRRLQEKHEMPDSSPEDTAAYAEQVLSRLLRSSANVRCSYATNDDDVEQTATDLLADRISDSEISDDDPGWYASKLTALTDIQPVTDPVPRVKAGEIISGGATAIQNQMSDPVTTFVVNRMSAKRIYPQAVGIPAPMRGNLIHDALYQLYIDLPSSEHIASWSLDELKARIGRALDYAFVRHEKNADAVLQQVLLLERQRLNQLLQQFVVTDASRDAFRIASVEGEFEFVAGHIHLSLRFDRIDQFDDGTCAILDYKTGSRKRLLNRDNEAQEYQLFVYACATDATISALALVNIDSREIVFDGAGRGFTDTDAWPALLQGIKKQIATACEQITAGDVRINIEQGLQSARPLNLLTRFTELKRDIR